MDDNELTPEGSPEEAVAEEADRDREMVEALMLDPEELSTDNSELRSDRAEDDPVGSAETVALI